MASLIINSQLIITNKIQDITSPETNERIGDLSLAGINEVNSCFEYAEKSFINWSNLTQFERNEFLLKVRDELLFQKDILAQIISDEIAKPLKSSLEEVARSAEYIQLTVESVNNIVPESFEAITKGYKKGQKIAFNQILPVGCVVCISPFNYPINLAITKIIPALISGNVVIFKPSSQGALSGFALASIFNSILPSGVLQFITGKSNEIGDALVQHESCNFINFTGSSKTGKHIASIANDNTKIGIKGMILEMGGKDSAIVTKNANLTLACSEILKGAYSFNGQRCTAIKRVFLDKSIAPIFLKDLQVQISRLTIGKANEDKNITSLINKESADYVEELFTDAKNSGCKKLFEFKRDMNIVYPNAVIYDQNISFLKNIRIFMEEQFGPILPVYIYTEINEVIDFINASEFGLQNSVFSENINECINISRKLESGSVQINGKPDRGPDNFPFSGIKNSGFGVQGVRESIMSMIRKKTIVINIH